MNDLCHKLQLLPEERALILKHGYPFERLENALKRWSKSQAIKRISVSEWELSMLIGELSRTFNHGEAGADEDDLIALCDRLEYTQQTGDGDLEMLGW
ncbi:hypothetical protein Pla175_28920 [Pirellulimonas nuda]|uniref:Uncharacterized protein n=1 Tax=Pirellulimonas nuda TaxID=2528009 RepID=A0A518DCG1_9BACT|nr:hypothetical protein [Pirellulimonas nuda]QDU89116.1 hypothetical protein Pla175_25020 [Pirellulimonas nuda]QDU89500.1 hypothetical protein Pla175_28920 [Pirellulimonas nuda]